MTADICFVVYHNSPSWTTTPYKTTDLIKIAFDNGFKLYQPIISSQNLPITNVGFVFNNGTQSNQTLSQMVVISTYNVIGKIITPLPAIINVTSIASGWEPVKNENIISTLGKICQSSQPYSTGLTGTNTALIVVICVLVPIIFYLAYRLFRHQQPNQF